MLISSAISRRKGNIKKCVYPGCDIFEVHDGKKWKGRWCKFNETDFLCSKHSAKVISNPRRTQEQIRNDNRKRYAKLTPEQRKAYNSKRNPLNDKRKLRYQHKQICVEEVPVREQCSICGNKIGDKYINSKKEIAYTKKIDLHHIKYHDENPLKDTIQYCSSCHMKESQRIKKFLKQKTSLM